MRKEGGGDRHRKTAVGGRAVLTMAGAMAAVLIVVLAPAGLALRANSTLSAPFHGTSATSGFASNGVCGTASGSSAKWKATTGVLTGSSKSTFKGCPYVGQFIYSSNSNWVYVYLPFTVPKSSFYNASFSFTWKLSTAMTVSPGSCPAAINYTSGYDYNYCEWGAAWYALVSTSLFDLTNGSAVSTTYNYWQLTNSTNARAYNDCAYGSCSASSASSAGVGSTNYQAPGYDFYSAPISPGTRSGSAALWTNTTDWHAGSGTSIPLLPHHTYALLAQVWFNTYVYSDGTKTIYTGSTYEYFYFNPAGSGSASIGAQPSPLGLSVTSVSISPVA